MPYTNPEDFISQLNLVIQGNLTEQEALFFRVSFEFDKPDLLDEKTFEASLNYLSRRLKTPNSNLQLSRIHVLLALCKLLSPRPLNPSDSRILDHLNFAIQMNEPLGFVLLAWCHFMGRGVSENKAEAFALSKKASDLNCALGLNQLAICYTQGIGIDENPKKAAALFQQASNLGCAQATCHLAWFYRQGKGVERSFRKATKLYQQASDAGSGEAARALAFYYHTAYGIKVNHIDPHEVFLFSMKALFNKINRVCSDVAVAIFNIGNALCIIAPSSLGAHAGDCTRMFARACAYLIRIFNNIDKQIKNKASSFLSILSQNSNDYKVHYWATMFTGKAINLKARLTNFINFNGPITGLMQQDPNAFVNCLADDNILSSAEKIPYFKLALNTCGAILSSRSHLRIR